MQKVQKAHANCIPVRHCQPADELSPFSTGVYAGADRLVPFVDELVEGLEEVLGIPKSRLPCELPELVLTASVCTGPVSWVSNSKHWL